jgi:hypothetical protein
LDAASRRFPEFIADVASFKNSVDRCVLTLLRVFIMISKEYYEILRPKF